MSLTTSYLLKFSNLEEFFNAVRTARAPDAFTYKFLKDLGFTSSNDRLLIGVLKGLGFLDEAGTPTQRYFTFLDQSHSGRVLAEGIREAYDDLFAINTRANELDVDDVKGKLRTLTQGRKSENVITQMASTFRALCDLADWTTAPTLAPVVTPTPITEITETETHSDEPLKAASTQSLGGMSLHYNIQIVLPEARDPKVYDAIFSSLKRHLT